MERKKDTKRDFKKTDKRERQIDRKTRGYIDDHVGMNQSTRRHAEKHKQTRVGIDKWTNQNRQKQYQFFVALKLLDQSVKEQDKQKDIKFNINFTNIQENVDAKETVENEDSINETDDHDQDNSQTEIEQGEGEDGEDEGEEEGKAKQRVGFRNGKLF